MVQFYGSMSFALDNPWVHRDPVQG